jgi:hypothetical protein
MGCIRVPLKLRFQRRRADESGRKNSRAESHRRFAHEAVKSTKAGRPAVLQPISISQAMLRMEAHEWD